MFLKILSDQECNLYVDGSFVCLIPSEELTKVPFEKGEYIVRFECTSFPELIIENDLVLEYDKVERLDFNQELQKHPEFISNHGLVPKKNGDGLWGYVIIGTTLWAIPPIYEMAKPFNNKYAVVHKGGTAGAINNRNELIVPFGVYSNLSYDSRLFVGIDSLGNHIVISQTGHRIGDITECGLTPIRAFNEFICLNYSDNGSRKWYGVYLDGSPIEELGVFDDFGEMYWRLFGPYPCHCYYIGKDGLFGVVMINNSTHSARWIKRCSLVFQANDNTHDDEYYDRHSEHICFESSEHCKYIFDYYPYLGVLVERREKQMEDESIQHSVSIYDNNGIEIFKRHKTTIDYFQDGFTLFHDHEKEEDYALNKDGRIIGPHVFRTGFFNGYAQISENDKYGLIDESDTIVIPCEYDYLDWLDRVCIHDEELQGFFPDYSSYKVQALKASLNVLVKKDGECGIFGLEQGEMLIPLSYKRILYKESGYYCEMDSGWDIYSYQGKMIDSGVKTCPEDNED